MEKKFKSVAQQAVEYYDIHKDNWQQTITNQSTKNLFFRGRIESIVRKLDEVFNKIDIKERTKYLNRLNRNENLDQYSGTYQRLETIYDKILCFDYYECEVQDALNYYADAEKTVDSLIAKLNDLK